MAEGVGPTGPVATPGAGGLLLVDRRHQALTALAAAVLEDLAASDGRHPRAEPMGSLAVRAAWLVRALHDKGLLETGAETNHRFTELSSGGARPGDRTHGAVGWSLRCRACGGGGGSSARLSKAEFQSQANAICAKYQQQIDAIETPTSLEQIPDLVDQILAILNKEVAEIRALNPPEELQSGFDQLLAATDRTKAAADDLANAAKAGDQAAVQKALEEGNAASKEADDLAANLGLDECVNPSGP